MLERLHNHKSIAIDVDGTLINGAGSEKLCNWVKTNHHNHELWVVTFRQTYEANKVWQDLRPYGVQAYHFMGLVNLPDQLHEQNKIYNDAMELFKQPSRIRKYYRFLAYHKITEETVLEYRKELLSWKGKVSNDLGCTMLIDDMTDLVSYGCEKYNIELIHPDHL